jgi:hypothetical protein
MKFHFSSAVAVAALCGASTAAAAAAATKLPGEIRSNEFDSGRDWMSFPNGVEFQPASAGQDDARLEHLRQLASQGFATVSSKSNHRRSLSVDTNPMGHALYVDGGETYYDEYAQAWRVLGWYIDCDVCEDGAEDADNNPDYSTCSIFQQDQRRRGVQEQEEGEDNNNNVNRQGCKRYLIWAAVRCQKNRHSSWKREHMFGRLVSLLH